MAQKPLRHNIFISFDRSLTGRIMSVSPVHNHDNLVTWNNKFYSLIAKTHSCYAYPEKSKCTSTLNVNSKKV